MSKPNIVLDASMLDTFSVCECKFNYRYNLNKTLPEKAKPLDRGGVIHLALEAYYKSIKAKENYDEAVRKMNEAFDEALIESDLEGSDIDLILNALQENVEYWRVYDQQFSINDVERPFIYLLAETDDVKIFMAGKIDLIISDNKYMNMPYDHKSHQREYPSRRLNNQFINYCVAAGSNYLLVNKIGLQKTLKPEQKYKRVPLSYDPLYIEEWKKNTIGWALKYLECVATDQWLMNLTSCDKYNRDCEYLEVCDSSGKEAKFYKLEANYETTEPWDVSKILEVKKKEEK